MRLVNIFIDARVVLQPVNPVDEEVVENHVQQRRDEDPRPAIVADIGVELAVAAHLAKEKRQAQQVNEWNGP